MRLVLVAAALLAMPLITTPSAAQRSGTYAVTGQAPDGTRYEGSAQLQATGPDTWRITWRIGSDTASGVGIKVGQVLIVGYLQGRDVGAAGYEVMPDGRLSGVWTAGREGGVGTEVMLPR